MKQYWECWKCGNYTVTDGDKPDFMCIAPMPARISGICGGNFTKEITKDEAEKKFKKKTNLH